MIIINDFRFLSSSFLFVYFLFFIFVVRWCWCTVELPAYCIIIFITLNYLNAVNLPFLCHSVSLYLLVFFWCGIRMFLNVVVVISMHYACLMVNIFFYLKIKEEIRWSRVLLSPYQKEIKYFRSFIYLFSFCSILSTTVQIIFFLLRLVSKQLVNVKPTGNEEKKSLSMNHILASNSTKKKKTKRGIIINNIARDKTNE